jgi:hypothetical protein
MTAMNQALRIVALAAILPGLSGCNMVVSEEPWFSAADAAPAPVLRDGLWRSTESDCRFEETKPAEQWPDCADAVFVRGEERWSMRWKDTDERGRHRRTFAGWQSGNPLHDGLAVPNGDHLIVQFRSDGAPDASPSDAADHGAGEAETPSYMYAAIRPAEYDGEGKATVLETWGVQCGPLPDPKPSPRRQSRSRRDEAEETTASVTDRPFPGLTVVDDDCIAESAEALRRAAVLSEALGNKNKSRWVREGWR